LQKKDLPSASPSVGKKERKKKLLGNFPYIYDILLIEIGFQPIGRGNGCQMFGIIENPLKAFTFGK
jgi:hypothetical protein